MQQQTGIGDRDRDDGGDDRKQYGAHDGVQKIVLYNFKKPNHKSKMQPLTASGSWRALEFCHREKYLSGRSIVFIHSATSLTPRDVAHYSRST